MIAAYLDKHRSEIEARIRQEMIKFVAVSDYSVIWKEYEKKAIAEFKLALCNGLPVLQNEAFEEGEAGRDKNRAADLLVNHAAEKVLVSVKACRDEKKSENDLGTLRSYAKKKATHTAMFEIWIVYDQITPTSVTQVYFDRAYKFVGRRRDERFLSYRKKDGNLRPKPWIMFRQQESFWNTLEEFEAAMERTVLIRFVDNAARTEVPESRQSSPAS